MPVPEEIDGRVSDGLEDGVQREALHLKYNSAVFWDCIHIMLGLLNLLSEKW